MGTELPTSKDLIGARSEIGGVPIGSAIDFTAAAQEGGMIGGIVA
jgi:hypothetical protein